MPGAVARRHRIKTESPIRPTGTTSSSSSLRADFSRVLPASNAVGTHLGRLGGIELRTLFVTASVLAFFTTYVLADVWTDHRPVHRRHERIALAVLFMLGLVLAATPGAAAATDKLFRGTVRRPSRPRLRVEVTCLDRSPLDLIAESTSSTARSRTSRGYRMAEGCLICGMAPSFQGREPPQDQGIQCPQILHAGR
jgi:hypothetical protein